MAKLGKLLGYANYDCPNCGRHRVERYENGLEICDKCNWCIQTNSYWTSEDDDENERRVERDT